MDKNKIKFDHFNNIKELIQHLEMWYAEDDYFAYDRWFHLDDARKMGIYVYEQYKEIERLNKELEQEKKDFTEANDKCFELILENKRINNIIKETSEDLHQVVKWCVENKHNENTIKRYLVVDYGTIVGKINEIRTKLDNGDDKE